MTIEIREFTDSDYDAVIALWRQAPGVVMRDVDAFGPLTAYRQRNPGLSFVAVERGTVVGAVLCGTDGRRGYLQHLAVALSHRHRGIGRELAERCVNALAAQGIDKCHLMVLTDNHDAATFWARLGWTERSDVRLMSHIASGVATA
jgi:ribosomal protein S18 acetylase RimI-like enzyme